MRAFPQLSSGAVSQLPLIASIRHRVVVNRLADGSRIAYADGMGEFRVWEIRFEALTDAEWSALSQLFTECDGRLGTFLFLDPTDNLLSMSEELSSLPWERDLGLTQLGAHSDPLGGQGAASLTNSTVVSRRLLQSVAIPGHYRYNFSVWLRSATSQAIRLAVQADASFAERVVVTSPKWERHSVTADLNSSVDQVTVFVEVPAGGIVEVFGLQLEAQPFMSGYKRTAIRGGIYSSARFMDDTLRQESQGVSSHNSVVRVLARREA